MVYVAWGYQPEGAANVWKGRIAALLCPMKIMGRLFYKTRAVAYKRLGLVKPYDAVFSPSPQIVRSKFDTKKIVVVNSADYDLFTEAERLSDPDLAQGYGVFLDNFMPYQSDLTFAGKRKVEPNQYFRVMNRFFDIVENKFGVPIVIACHPKASYKPAQFAGRKLFYGKTASLVKYCELVISHHSSSVGYAVLARRPVIFTYTQEMMDLYWQDRVMTIRDTATYLERPIYNADKVLTENEVECGPVNAERYQRYQNEYLSAPRLSRVPTRDIFYSEMRTMLNEP